MMNTLENALALRTKKIGILILDARRSARQTIENCAEIINVSVEEYKAMEFGEKMPTLPQLEVLAFYFDVPLAHFWGNQALSEKPQFVLNTTALLPIRQKIIGITLRQLRTNAGLTIQEFGERFQITAEQMNRYELGEEDLPLPLLEQMLAVLNENISIVADQHGQIGKWYKTQKALDSVINYPADIQDFMTKSINGPYLELAKKLSEMDAAKLRSIAEGLLEITY